MNQLSLQSHQLDDELENLPHVVLTSDLDWDPAVLDHELDLEDWKDAPMDLPGINSYGCNKFDPLGHYRGRVVNLTYLDSYEDLPADDFEGKVDSLGVKLIATIAIDSRAVH